MNDLYCAQYDLVTLFADLSRRLKNPEYKEPANFVSVIANLMEEEEEEK